MLSWETNSGLSSNKRLCAIRPEYMAHPGLCILPMRLPSQPATNACLKDDLLQHDISCTQHDLGRSGSKGSFFCENSRSSFWSPYSSTLSVVSEDKPWESSSSMCDSCFHDGRSSLSSLSSSEDGSSCSLGDVFEVQSSYKGPLANMYSLEEALPRKRGLSGFFTGKSRSFSCLADVTAVEDLAKPENPYSKRRKCISACNGNSDRSRMRPLPTRVVGISKKTFHRSKYTSAFPGVSADVKEGEQEGQLTHPLTILKTLRSYSLSDLEGVGSQFSPDDE